MKYLVQAKLEIHTRLRALNWTRWQRFWVDLFWKWEYLSKGIVKLALCMKYQAYFPRFRQDSADLLSDVEKSLTVGVRCHVQNKFYVICEISAQHPMSYKRCQDPEGTVPLSTRPTWSGWTSGTTSSSATWAGGALTNTSKIQTQVLIDHPGNFFIFFRVDTLLRHAHFSIQSRRLWKQFDSEVRRLLDPFLLVQHKNNGKHDFTHWQKAFLPELSNKRR